MGYKVDRRVERSPELAARLEAARRQCLEAESGC